jgi:A/G-specific adenine glycosylase
LGGRSHSLLPTPTEMPDHATAQTEESTTDGLPEPDPAKIAAVRAGLLAWFAANARDLPWRRTREPYRILVSEVMLQQTQVDRVVPYYEAFLDRFPTVRALAEAPTAEVIRLWSGLGYNRRAVNLQRTARYVVDERGGEFPRDAEGLRKLPGVGPYTAGAIAAFAYEEDAAFVDTNMRRVLHRVFVGSDVPAPTASERLVLAIAAAAIPAGQGWEWNQALIEFGALHCTARKPLCVVCPLQAECRAFPRVLSDLATLPKGVRLKREAPYAGSTRYYRGRVIETLRGLPAERKDGIDLLALGPAIRSDFTTDDVPWLYEVVKGLSRDGLALVAEERATYDAGNATGDSDAADLAAVKVRLP